MELDNKRTTNREQSAGNKNGNQDRAGNRNKNSTGASNDNSTKVNNKKEIYNNRMDNYDKRY